MGLLCNLIAVNSTAGISQFCCLIEVKLEETQRNELAMLELIASSLQTS